MMKRKTGITAVFFFISIPLTLFLIFSFRGRGWAEGNLTQASGGESIRSSERRDPFIPLIPEELLEAKIPEFSGSEIILQAILIMQDRRGAIINNHFLQEGDMVPALEIKVVRIEKERVIVNYRLNDYQLRIWKFSPILK